MLQKFKEKVCVNKLCLLIQHIVFNTYYKLGVGTVLAVLFGILYNLVPEDSLAATIFITLHFGGFAIILVIALIAIAYAWIINPIRGLIRKYGK